jgi:hypothetical protein
LQSGNQNSLKQTFEQKQKQKKQQKILFREINLKIIDNEWK